ncbi:hypothetical protein CONPUDRAFT_155819 [Coniophora puteana RWD-64-598 SS2]|uniref:Uncharacterized protein n=1 Tax=Coniophora puteana (strain RWD-64-598) TaxID=741705 RepID=A0A5M3MIR1_CONPW|nr:uncharacterized protein CONPUDRAFT_155819 [Coniophora puteana RWD-64-598 SS2]EIW79139.1 hypothetical protein CONPUDRAFT_155819 [Coniophora puteana RWD-64-598 SS2]
MEMLHPEKDSSNSVTRVGRLTDAPVPIRPRSRLDTIAECDDTPGVTKKSLPLTAGAAPEDANERRGQDIPRDDAIDAEGFKTPRQVTRASNPRLKSPGIADGNCFPHGPWGDSDMEANDADDEHAGENDNDFSDNPDNIPQERDEPTIRHKGPKTPGFDLPGAPIDESTPGAPRVGDTKGKARAEPNLYYKNIDHVSKLYGMNIDRLLKENDSLQESNTVLN